MSWRPVTDSVLSTTQAARFETLRCNGISAQYPVLSDFLHDGDNILEAYIVVGEAHSCVGIKIGPGPQVQTLAYFSL